MVFKDRTQAGQMLAPKLSRYKGREVVVAALPRGGIVVAAEVAKYLQCPLDIVLVKKIGHPFYPEFAIGAVVDGHPALYHIRNSEGLHKSLVMHAENAARKVLGERRKMYKDDTPELPLRNKTVILVDDGMATGLTMQAAIEAAKSAGSKKIVIAVPVASRESIVSIKKAVKEIIVIEKPESFSGAVGGHYMEFDQVADSEVINLMKEANSRVYKTTAHQN